VQVDVWTAAFNTVSASADRLYALLVQNSSLRDWVVTDYFSALTLHERLLSSWFPEIGPAIKDDTLDDPAIAPIVAERDRISRILDEVRDNPVQPGQVRDDDQNAGPGARDLVRLTLELLHAPGIETPRVTVRQRLREAMLALLPDFARERVEKEADMNVLRFELTLVLAVLHHQLDIVTDLWAVVEQALHLEGMPNALSRRPPQDYEPVIPETPMGNVLGFQFQLDGEGSGALRFFRCSGVGREILLRLHDLPAVDSRPCPNVLLMSATSWAGTSSRYHVHVPVGAVLRPRKEEVEAILHTAFRREFLSGPDGNALRLSGAGVENRPWVLRQMLRQLAEPEPGFTGAKSKLAEELADIDDPDRRRILLLTGSYAEAREAADYLNSLPEWHGRVTSLVSDDANADDAWAAPGGGAGASRLRRGDVTRFSASSSEILVAPLLAIERGHNIVVAGGKAAIGTVYFLARPHPRPDDITLAVHTLNDWAVRYVRDGQFARDIRNPKGPKGRGKSSKKLTPDAAGLAFRRRARQQWQHYLVRSVAWSALPRDEKLSFTWDQLVVMWQVIGRLVRGGVPARVVLVDAAFFPREAKLTGADTPNSSLPLSMRQVLAPYFTNDPGIRRADRELVTYLYEPLYKALGDLT
jgi:hypothetical protein